MAAIVLAEVRTNLEREAVAEWAASKHPDAPVRTLDEVDPEALDPATTLIPARVVWLPPMRKGERRVSMADVLVPVSYTHLTLPTIYSV